MTFVHNGAKGDVTSSPAQRSAFANLLEIAQRHTSRGIVVSLSLAVDSDCIRGTVSDSGRGVAEADIGRPAKRFARIETSRNSEGYGLGLSLVSAVAKLHGGQLVLRKADQGLSATIELPEGMEAEQAA
jgi:signal transduction histidine kinase